MNIAHLADTHIKNLRYHSDYRKVFNCLFRMLKEDSPDIIVHCGDIAHTKTQISPEFVEMTSWFLSNLADIAPLYIILGNHDGNLKNKNRQDAITPIVDALGRPNIHLLKNSGETIVDETVTLNVLSIFDRENWVSPTNIEKINIALYHGTIAGAQTDLGYVLQEGQDDVDIFKDHDFAMLGDIHKQQAIDHEERVWYCGSTIQQNHGEGKFKGYLYWEIKDKDNWNVYPVDVYNHHTFETIHINSDGEIVENLNIEDKRVRVVDTHGPPKHVLKEILSNIRQNKPKSLKFVPKKAQSVIKHVENKAINVRDVGTQRDLLASFLAPKALSKSQFSDIYELNDQINTDLDDSHLARNITWAIKSFKWAGLFNYQEESSLNFSEYRGLVGIFGKNFTGKSSVIDSILFTIFGTTSKKEKKLVNVINNHSKKGFGEVVIESGGKLYTIRRELKKVKRKGVDAATSSVIFTCVSNGKETSLNETTRVKTDKAIQSYFGTYQDFAMSSLASQTDSLNFISEGSTKRKEIVANFLDLEHFAKKTKLAKEEASQTKALVRKLSTKDHSEAKRKLAEEIDAIKGKLRFLEEGVKYSMSKKQIEYYKTLGSAQQRVEILKAEHQELKELERRAYLYDCYIEAVNTNGIPYQIIQEKIPVINQEIASFLVGVVDFDIYFECNDKNLDIFIKHPEQNPRPIEMASGAEKTMASMAIRLALLSVSSLPKVDLFILDEPGTALDEDNLSGFIDILELIKMNFSTTLLISHLQSLKDSVDKEITIQNTNKGARVL